jgi:hypothetical protein
LSSEAYSQKTGIFAQSSLDGLWLLVDLLGHEVGIAAQGRRGGVPVDVQGRGVLDHAAVGVIHDHAAVLGEARELVVVELDDVGGHGCERSHVGGGVGTVRRGGHDERGALARDDDLPGGVRAHHGERPGPLEPLARVAHGAHEVTLRGPVPGVLDQVGDDLGVGVAPQRVAGAGEIGAQLLEVLDDAVVDDGDAAAAIQVGVSVPVGRGAVRGPTRVRDAGVAHQVGGAAPLHQGGNPAGALHAVQLAVTGEDVDPRRVIAAVLKGGKAGEQVVLRLLLSRVANDSTHVSVSSGRHGLSSLL